MIIDLIVRRAIDVWIAFQKSVWEAQVNRADFVEALPLFVSEFPIEYAHIVFELGDGEVKDIRYPNPH